MIKYFTRCFRERAIASDAIQSESRCCRTASEAFPPRRSALSLSVFMSICMLVMSHSGYAHANTAQIRAAKMCTKHFPKQERIHGIPTHLLAAISSTESGRWSKELGMALPWPWTINVEGKGFYLDSKAEAIAKVRYYQNKGVKSIDVGCMQVNLKHHPMAFSSLDQAFDPYYNIAYAAKFLRRNYDEQKSWIKATAAYHSKTPKYGNKYLEIIEKNWSRIVNKVRTARSERGLAPGQYAINVSQRRQEQQFASLEKEFANAGNGIALRDVDKLGFVAGKSKPTYAPKKISKRKSMRVIKVRDADDKNQRVNTMVIRPQITNASATVKEAKVADKATASLVSGNDLFVSQYGKTSSKRMTNNDSSDKHSPKRQTPKFIFVE